MTWGVLSIVCWSSVLILFCMHYCVSILVVQSSKLVALLSVSHRCIATGNVLPHDAVCWSAVCDCGIS